MCTTQGGQKYSNSAAEVCAILDKNKKSKKYTKCGLGLPGEIIKMSMIIKKKKLN